MKKCTKYHSIHYLLIITLVLYVCNCSNKRNLKAEEYNRKSVKAWKNKDYEKAIDFASKAISFNNNVARIYYNRGLSYLDNGNYEEAIQDFTQAIKLYKDSNEFLIKRYKAMFLRRGLAYQFTEKHDEAIKDFTEYIDIDSLNAEIYFFRAKSYSLRDSLLYAKQDFNTALRLDSTNKVVYMCRPLVLFDLKEYGKALDDLNTALEDKDSLPENFFLLFGRGATLIELKMYQKAKLDIENYIKYESQDAVAYLLLAVIHYKLNDFVLANDYFNKADSLKILKEESWEIYDPFIYYSTNIKSILKELGKL